MGSFNYDKIKSSLIYYNFDENIYTGEERVFFELNDWMKGTINESWIERKYLNFFLSFIDII